MIRPEWLDFTMEQNFHLRRVEDDVESLSKTEMRELLISSTKLLMLRENMIKGLLMEKLQAERM